LILLDTSGLLAWIDQSQRLHEAVVNRMKFTRPPYLLSPFVLAEADYLLSSRVGSFAQRALLREVGEGAFRLESFSALEVGQALKVLEKYGDLSVGLTDASIVVLAERYGIRNLLTLDERHFRALRGPRGEPFRLLPADF
jgi:predicted nucleic acid-binding protein